MALQKKPIKTDLFKFVTLRTPQLINEQKKDIGFIFHNTTTKTSSKFLKTVIDTTTIDESRTIVRTAVPNFIPLKSYLQVKNVNPLMYEFSLWLMNNRNILFVPETNQKLAQVAKPSLTKTEENKLWDNLYYQALTRKSSYVRQACIQMLVAHNFLKNRSKYSPTKYSFTEEEYLVKLANAKVVIDKAFTKSNTQKTSKRSLNNKTLKNLRSVATNYYLRKGINNYNQTIADIKKVENLYTKDYEKALQTAKDAYDATTKPLITAAKNIQKTEQNAENLNAITEKRQPRVIPIELDLPEFNFSFQKQFATDYLPLLKTQTKEILKTYGIDNKSDNTFIETLKTLDEEVKSINNILFSAVNKTETKIFIDGNEVVTRRGNLGTACFIIFGRGHINTGSGGNGGGFDPNPIDDGIDCGNNQTCQRIITSGFIHLMIDFGSNSVITAQNHAVTINGTTITSLIPSVINPNNNGQISLNIFPAEDLVFTGSTLTLSGSFTLSNGDQIDYSKQLTINNNEVFNTGCGTLISLPPDTGGSGTTTTTTTTTTTQDTSFEKLYGVGKIGIADFRKVEQEVCCYVAGEVSHIENILAREYKKRETRNLLVSESTVEKSSEKEIENLSDTTTTARNELQSEISSVLNEDESQSYGASAGVTGGKIVTFNVNAYADFANSSSSSQSNSDAQTYAQEITERTLERIVQKTSTKRTSRVLKEFEEKNEHGFDNREGTEHVSGVYRWIDIIYKNQLVNYGKRLMYEFMVPEPSRFFKDAIKQNSENNVETCDNIVVLEKPIHPSDLGGNLAISDASQLDSNNYLQLASIYNTSVNALPSDIIKINKGFTFNSREQTGNSLKDKIDIPNGYEAINFKVLGSNIHQGSNNSAEINIAVGNELYTSSNSRSFQSDSITLDSIKNELGISSSNYDSLDASFTVYVECQRTFEALEQWQNETYKAILDAYNEQLQAYYDAKKEACANKQIEDASTQKEDIKFSNSFNRTIEKREIKRIAIEMLTLPFDNPMSKDNYLNYDPDNDELPVVDKTEAFENHAAHVKFFEQAFDWEIMAYLFYPYYWAKDSDWKVLYQQSSPSDPIFQAFLQSGMARAVVPVRPGFEDAVNYYIETGDIWNGGDLVIDQENDLYLSIAAEMQNIEGKVEKEWETRVPTALTMVQKDTVGLDETGLPCCDFVLGDPNAPTFENTIKSKLNNLGVVLDNDTTVTDGLAAAIEVIKAKLNLDKDSIDRLNTEINNVGSNIVENIIIDTSKKFLELTTAKNVVVAKIEITAIKAALGL